MQLFSIRFERRERVNRYLQLLGLVATIVCSLLVSAILILLAGASIRESFSALFIGAFGSWNAIIETLVKSTPLILTGLSVTIAFRCQIWSIGSEGQLMAGAMAAYWASTFLAWLPQTLLFIAIVFAGFLGGAICGLIPGYLKGKKGVDEVIVTVMLNFIVIYLLNYLLSGPWQDPNQHYFWSPSVPESAYYPLLPLTNSRLHIGFIIALIATFFCHWLLLKSRLGFEIRAVGMNPIAAKFKGVNVAHIIIIAMLISGGIAGLAGAGEVFGLNHRLRAEIITGYGYTGIIIAMLANLNPIAVIPAAILFGGLVNGSNRMQIITGVPIYLVYVMQAIILIFLVISQVLVTYRLKKVKHGLDNHN